MYGGGTSGDVPPSVLDGVICVGSIVVAFLRHASASLCGDSLPTLLLFHGAKSELNALSGRQRFVDALQRKQPRHHSRLLRWRGACCYV